jgi:hypothetical protein
MTALALTLLVSAAQVQEGPSPDLSARSEPQLRLEIFKDDVRDYFGGEKGQAWVWLGTGLVLGGTGGYLSFGQPGFLGHGLGWPLMAVSLVELAAGTVLLVRTGAQTDRLLADLDARPQDSLATELARIQRVNNTFRILRWVEFAVVAVGVALAGIALVSERETLGGVGVGLLAQGGAMLALDHFAHLRAKLYQSRMEAYRDGAPHPSGE